MSLRQQHTRIVDRLEADLGRFVYAQFPIRVTDRVVTDRGGNVAERRVDELELFVTAEGRWIQCFGLVPDFDGGWEREWRGIVEGEAVSELLARHAHRWAAAVGASIG